MVNASSPQYVRQVGQDKCLVPITGM